MLTIEVFFDLICPWCLIGKRNLDAALERLAEARPDARVKLVWRSYRLLPDTPLDGLPYQAFYLARLGSAEAVAARRAQVRQAGRAAGVELAFERIERLPNTAAAHHLVAYAGAKGTPAQQAALIDHLFVAYFMEGKDIGDLRVLERLGIECGIAREGWLEALEATQRQGSERGERALPADRVVDGVPLFVFNDVVALAGAYSSDAILQEMLQSMNSQGAA